MYLLFHEYNSEVITQLWEYNYKFVKQILIKYEYLLMYIKVMKERILWGNLWIFFVCYKWYFSFIITWFYEYIGGIIFV